MTSLKIGTEYKSVSGKKYKLLDISLHFTKVGAEPVAIVRYGGDDFECV